MGNDLEIGLEGDLEGVAVDDRLRGGLGDPLHVWGQQLDLAQAVESRGDSHRAAAEDEGVVSEHVEGWWVGFSEDDVSTLEICGGRRVWNLL